MSVAGDETPLVSRRRVLLAGAACVLAYDPADAARIKPTPGQTEGPFFVDERLSRSDIRIDPSDGSVQEGFPLELAIRVTRIHRTKLTPFRGALVDVWHCNALGRYSDAFNDL